MKIALKKALCIAVGVGAIYSFIFWSGPTYATIHSQGYYIAFVKTFIPRLMQDAATLVLSILAFNAFRKHN